MEDAFSIYIDRLRAGKEEVMEESLDPSFLDVDEPDLSFPEEVKVHVKAYIAEKELLLFFKVAAVASIPCSICNAEVLVPIQEELVHSVPVEEIPSGVYSFKEFLRETILLGAPQFAECSGGKCPRRNEITPYFRESKESEDEGTYKPFADWPFEQ